MRPTICSLFEPHYKQNLYTNPKRTAKSYALRTLIDKQQRYLFKELVLFKDAGEPGEPAPTLAAPTATTLLFPRDPLPVKSEPKKYL